MNGLQGVDVVALSWCIPEMRQSLLRAGVELDLHLADPPGSSVHLKSARMHLHQAYGALQVADAAGVMVLTQEARSILERGERNELAIGGHAVGVLKAALSASIEYLEDLESGSTLPPLVLFSFYREMLMLRGAERIDPADLYFPELRIPLPAGILLQADAADGDDIGMLAASARREFERALLGFLRGDDNVTSIRMMHSAMVRMQRANPARDARAFFWISLALIDALKHAALPLDLAAKRLVARVNLQARRTLESQDPVADRLLKDLLFALARAGDGAPIAAEVRHHYHLAGTVPADFERVRYGLCDPARVRAAREALVTLRKSWERIVRGAQAEQGTFAAATGDLAESLCSLPYPGMCDLAQALGVVPTAFASPRAPDDSLSLEVATVILFAEAALGGGLRADEAYDSHAGQLGCRLLELLSRPDAIGAAKAVPQWLVDISLKASERMALTAFVAGLKANLRTCEQTLDDYFRDASTVARLAALKAPLDQSRGLLKVMGHEEAALACAALDEDVQRLAGTGGDHQRIADNLSALEFFVESLLHPDGRRVTYRFDAVAREFRGRVADRRAGRREGTGVDEPPVMSGEPLVAAQQEQAAFAAAGVTFEPASVAFELERVASQREGVASEREGVASEPMIIAPVENAPPADTAVDDQRALREIFLLEADEVLAAIAGSLRESMSARSEIGPLTAIRSAFHTLGAASRMVGLARLGDVGLACEQVLDWWLAQERPGTARLYRLLENGHEFFSIWVSQLRQDPSAAMDASSLLAQCADLRQERQSVALVRPVADEESAPPRQIAAG